MRLLGMDFPERNDALSFLVVRRDNIGDLVCTTPLLTALRTYFPRARIEVLVNSYNAAVLRQHPAVDRLHVYTKLKHRTPEHGFWRILLQRLLLMRRLRRRHFDYVLIAGRGGVARSVSLVRKFRPDCIVALTGSDGHVPVGVDLPVARTVRPRHEVEETFELLRPLGIVGRPPPVRVVVTPTEHKRAAVQLFSQGWTADGPRIAVHISARKPSNRWTVEGFVGLIRKIHEVEAASFVLFWSPGSRDNALHPGDDEMARAILEELTDVPIIGYRTQQLDELIGGIALCDRMVCSDGGAMHIAAALDKPILCFFGDSDPARWHPWGVPYVLLQPPARQVSAISIDEAFAGFQQLLACSQVSRTSEDGAATAAAALRTS